MKLKSILITLGLVTLSCLSLRAQSDKALMADSKKDLEREYLRPSVATIYITDGHKYSKKLARRLDSNRQPDEYFAINLSERMFDFPLSQSILKSKKKRMKEVKTYVESLIKQKKFANQIVKDWFPKYDYEQQAYSLERLYERGRSAANDNQVILNKRTHRKDLFYNIGEKLVDRSYLIVHYIYYPRNPNGWMMYFSFGMLGHGKAKVSTFVYKLDFSKKVIDEFYQEGFNRNDGIAHTDFKLKYLSQDSKSFAYKMPWRMFSKNKTSKKWQKANKELHFNLAQSIADFQPKNTIYKTTPIRSKIGEKEGVYTSERFYVMEREMTRNGEIKTRRIGAVRAGAHIAKNKGVATGHQTDMTKFIQYSGGAIKEGMTLVAKPETGISLVPYYSPDYWGIQGEWRLSRMNRWHKGWHVPDIYLTVGLQYPLGKGHKKAMPDNRELIIMSPIMFGLGYEQTIWRMFSVNVQAKIGGAHLTLTDPDNKWDDMSNKIYMGTDDITEVRVENSNTKNQKYPYRREIRYKGDRAVGGGIFEFQTRLGIQLTPSVQAFGFGAYQTYYGNVGAVAKDVIGVKPFTFGAGLKLSF